MLRSLALAGAFLCALSLNAEARQRRPPAIAPECNLTMPCDFGGNNFLAGVRSIKVTMKRVHAKTREKISNSFQGRRVSRFAASNEGTRINTVILPHPAGCPSRAFCGCGAAVRIFGHQVRELWLAANWFRYPRAAPAPGMAAVRRHHVFVLEQHLGGDTWLAYDANSGGHATRLHARSIAGYTIVDPRG